MNKRIFKYTLIIICLFFIGIIPVSAKENCISVKEKLEKYDSYTNILNSIDCSDNSNETNVATCNEFNVRKNIIVTELMKKNDEKSICSSEKKQVNKIIKENKDNCGQIFNEDFNKFVNNILKLFYIVGPILLILFGSLDFAKATASSERDVLKKASVNFAKRLTATLLLFLTPTIINIILSFNVSDKYLSGNAYTCNYKYSVFNKKYTITYVPKSNSSTSSTAITGNGDILAAAAQIHSKYEKEKWTYAASIGNDIAAATNDPNKHTVCATFVASVLYVSGAIPEETLNKYSYQEAYTGIESVLIDNGWTQITNYDDLQPGDIVFMPEHVQIYAGKDSSGNDLWYNAGTTEAIQRENPYNQGEWARSRFKSARRKP